MTQFINISNSILIFLLVLIAIQAQLLLQIVVSIKTWPFTKTEYSQYGRWSRLLKLFQLIGYISLVFLFFAILEAWFGALLGHTVSILINGVFLVILLLIFSKIDKNDILDSSLYEGPGWLYFKKGTYAAKCFNLINIAIGLAFLIVIIINLIK